MKRRILLVEDELAIRDLLRFSLNQANFGVLEADNTKMARELIANQAPHLILLDWMLPDQSGVDFARQLKRDKLTRDIPIIMLTARAEETSKVMGLEAGADDYVTKPFSPRELMARIQTVLRRGPLINPDNLVQIGELCVDVDAHQVRVGDAILALSPMEYKLLYFFVTHVNRVYSREKLLNRVWKHAIEIDERTVDVHVRRLRSRLKPFALDSLLKTVRGEGYQFKQDAS